MVDGGAGDSGGGLCAVYEEVLSSARRVFGVVEKIGECCYEDYTGFIG